MNWIQLVATYLPVVLGGVVAVENAIKNEPGSTKQQVVVDSILAASQVGEQAPNATAAQISALVNVVVGTLNATGVFSHTQKP